MRRAAIPLALLIAGISWGCEGTTVPTAPTLMSSSSAVVLPDDDPSPTSYGVIDGIVTAGGHAERIPYRGVLIEALVGDVVAATSTSEDNGIYHLRVGVGEIRLRASTSGYHTSTTAPFSLAAGKRTRYDLRIEPVYTL